MSCRGGTSNGFFRLRGIAPPSGDKHRGRINDQRSGRISVRSARTRRINRSGGLLPRTVRGIRQSVGRNWLSYKNDVSVKHATSPSRRDRSRQAVIPRVSKVSPARTSSRSVARPVRSARPNYHLLTVGFRCFCRCRISLDALLMEPALA